MYKIEAAFNLLQADWPLDRMTVKHFDIALLPTQHFSSTFMRMEYTFDTVS